MKASNYNNTKNYNKNEGTAFDVGLIAQLTNKEEGLLSVASKAMGKDLKRMCKKYDTKIASFQNQNNFCLEEEYFFSGFQVPSHLFREKTRVISRAVDLVYLLEKIIFPYLCFICLIDTRTPRKKKTSQLNGHQICLLRRSGPKRVEMKTKRRRVPTKRSFRLRK